MIRSISFTIPARVTFTIVVALLLTGCAGIPLTTLVKLARFDSSRLLTLDPGELVVAINADERARSIEHSPTTFELRITPNNPAQWAPMERTVPMRVINMGPDFHLDLPGTGRRWLLYGFGTEEADELRAIQRHFQGLQEHAHGDGGQVSFGIGQTWLPTHYPQLRSSAVETWLRLERREGFFKVWAGEVQDLEKASKD